MSIHIIRFITICSCNSSSYNIDASLLSDIWFSKLFSNSVGCQRLLFFDDVQHNYFFSYHSLVFQCNCLLFNVKIMVVLMVKNLSANAGDTTDSDLILVRKIPWRRKWQPPPPPSILAWKIPWAEEPSGLQSMSCTWLSTYTRLFKRFQFSSVAHSCLTLATPWTAAHQASLSIINSQSLLKLISIASVTPSNFPSIRVFSNESVLCIRRPKY